MYSLKFDKRVSLMYFGHLGRIYRYTMQTLASLCNGMNKMSDEKVMIGKFILRLLTYVSF
jgi:hypothetical protein